MANDKRPWSAPQIVFTALITIVGWSAIGFSWFGFGFNWETQTSSARMSNEILVENLAMICEDQARKSAGADASIKELAALANWKRRTFVDEAGWATMPGAESSKSGVAELCGVNLLKT